MDPLKISAQFAAFVWFKNRFGANAPKDRQAWAYAHKAWRSFLPVANEGMGRLLIAMAKGRSDRKPLKRPSRKLALAS